jgi:hydroxymethylpyrimidine pyrophosphatase-like HAD family hydrolase
MRYQALAVDYDGTLATDGHVDEATRAALRRLKAAAAGSCSSRAGSSRM